MNSHTILGRWYATPLTPEQAQEQLEVLTARQERSLRHGGNTLCCRLGQMQARFWLGKSIYEEYRSLHHLAGHSAHGRALLELVCGQLQASRRLNSATEHLQQGFELARSLFTADDYFEVLERHRLLKLLPLSNTPTPAEPLQKLLIIARVIEQLERPELKRQHYVFDKSDTYG